MRSFDKIKHLFSALVLGVLAFTLVACGGSETPKHATVQPGTMPDDGDWTGVYYSTVYGNLHLIRNGDSANGAWRTTAGDKWGELHGEIQGNLLRYEWVEHTIGMVGPSATSRGKGYFLYVAPKEGEAHEIKGEWGLGQEDAGNSWEAVKQRNLVPNLGEVRPDEVEGRVQGGEWDSPSQGGDSESSEEEDME